jgi:hypothetical protein
MCFHLRLLLVVPVYTVVVVVHRLTGEVDARGALLTLQTPILTVDRILLRHTTPVQMERGWLLLLSMWV